VIAVSILAEGWDQCFQAVVLIFFCDANVAWDCGAFVPSGTGEDGFKEGWIDGCVAGNVGTELPSRVTVVELGQIGSAIALQEGWRY
jgi:hypothetical protein